MATNTQGTTSNKVKAGIAGVSVAALLAVGGALSYFTDYDSQTSGMQYGQVNIKLNNETLSTAGGAYKDRIMPNRVLPYKASITNEGTNDAYVFAKVTVPYIAATDVAAQDGTKTSNAEKVDLIEYAMPGWTNVEVDAADVDVEGGTAVQVPIKAGVNKTGVVSSDGNYITYLYGYTGGTAINGTALAKVTTDKKITVDADNSIHLFEGDEIRVANVINQTTFANVEKNITVETYAIQTEDIGVHDQAASDAGKDFTSAGDAATAPATVWDVLHANGASNYFTD